MNLTLAEHLMNLTLAGQLVSLTLAGQLVNLTLAIIGITFGRPPTRTWFQAILCRFKPEDKKEIALTLTKDHNPNVYEERMRIQKHGGTVK